MQDVVCKDCWVLYAGKKPSSQNSDDRKITNKQKNASWNIIELGLLNTQELSTKGPLLNCVYCIDVQNAK